MASGTCADCHGDGCESCHGSGWCAQCGAVGSYCSFCKSPTVRLSGGHSDCTCCQQESGCCAACANAKVMECPACAAGDIAEEAANIAAQAPPAEPELTFYPEFDGWWDEVGVALGNQLPFDKP